MRIALAVVACLAGTANARPTVTTTVDFNLGALEVGHAHGFVAPGGYFDLGASLGDVRLQLELDRAMWSQPGVAAGLDGSGSFTRIGAGLRWYWMNLPYGPIDEPARGRMRAYLEGGVGHHWVSTPLVDASVRDVELGFGMAQESSVGKVLVGGNFGIRVIVSDPDVALFFVLGGVFGA